MIRSTPRVLLYAYIRSKLVCLSESTLRGPEEAVPWRPHYRGACRVRRLRWPHQPANQDLRDYQEVKLLPRDRLLLCHLAAGAVDLHEVSRQLDCQKAAGYSGRPTSCHRGDYAAEAVPLHAHAQVHGVHGAVHPGAH